jgi:hypothetical protein
VIIIVSRFAEGVQELVTHIGTGQSAQHRQGKIHARLEEMPVEARLHSLEDILQLAAHAQQRAVFEVLEPRAIVAPFQASGPREQIPTIILPIHHPLSPGSKHEIASFGA